MAAGRLLRRICGWLETRRARAHFSVTITSPFLLSSLSCKSSVDLFIITVLAAGVVHQHLPSHLRLIYKKSSKNNNSQQHQETYLILNRYSQAYIYYS